MMKCGEWKLAGPVSDYDVVIPTHFFVEALAEGITAINGTCNNVWEIEQFCGSQEMHWLSFLGFLSGNKIYQKTLNPMHLFFPISFLKNLCFI
jgi:hypothetical protein